MQLVLRDILVYLAVVEGPVAGDLVLESVAEGVYVRGKISGRAEFNCARCLKAFEGAFEVDADGLFADRPDDDDYPLEEPGELDPEQMVRDVVLLAIPFSPLCQPECKGLCPHCGADRNLGECACPERTADPRWAALEDFAGK